jgi:hypothetical protein
MSRIATATVLTMVAVSVAAQAPPLPTGVIVQTPPSARQISSNPYGIVLNPGERLLSVGGVGVNGYPQLQVQTTRPPAPTGCPTCAPGSTYQTNIPTPSGYGLPHQATAERRARTMATRRLKSHPPGSFGTNFEGVGWTSRRGGTPPTCVPGRRGGVADNSDSSWVLVGDATVQGPDGAYRCRLWNRAGRSTNVATRPYRQSAPGVYPSQPPAQPAAGGYPSRGGRFGGRLRGLFRRR